MCRMLHGWLSGQTNKYEYELKKHKQIQQGTRTVLHFWEYSHSCRVSI